MNRSSFCTDTALLDTISLSLVSVKDCLLEFDKIKYDVKIPTNDHVQARQSYVSKELHQKVSIDSLAETFCISPKKVEATFSFTNQCEVRSAILLLFRRY